MKYFYLFLTLILCLFGIQSHAQVKEIRDIRLAPYQTGVVRLVAETHAKPDFTVFKLQNPSRLVVDFTDAKFHENASSKSGASADFVNAVRLGTPKDKTCRVVLELPHDNIDESHFVIPPDRGGNWRFVMDLSNKTVFTGSPTAGTIALNKTELPKTLPLPTPVPSKSPRKKIIMLDPGHGGADPGAISISGKYEKHLTLSMARELRSDLENAGYRVFLTRDKDVAIPLRQRFEKAHNANADLFISIHADSATNKKAKGLSIYTISERASDKEAAALAERENKADIILGLDLGGYQPEVSNILIDLAKRDTMGKSSQYADCVVTEMRRMVDLVPQAHRFAGFAVLKSPNIPSVLLEMGYLSNKEEDKLLQKSSYRAKLSKAMTKAVDNYFKNISE